MRFSNHVKRRRRLRLVEVEVLLDFLPVGGLRQGELQEDAGLLRIQFAGGDPVLGLVVHFSVLRGGAVGTREERTTTAPFFVACSRTGQMDLWMLPLPTPAFTMPL